MGKKLTKAQQAKALKIVAEWLGPTLGHDGPAPTGEEAARHAQGPMLNPEWDWPSTGPTPTILLEGGPEDWAVLAAAQTREQMTAIGVFAEPYAAWALCLYPY